MKVQGADSPGVINLADCFLPWESTNPAAPHARVITGINDIQSSVASGALPYFLVDVES